MPYQTVLFDLDHTLFDSDTSEALAFSQTLELAGITATRDNFGIYDRINKALWAAVERGEKSPSVVKVQRWELFADELEIDAAPTSLAASFANGLSQNGELYQGAREILESLRNITTLGLVTNGLSAVQRTRIERLELADYFAVIAISDELGVSKPDTAFLDVVFEALGQPNRATTVIVGDSLTSDMAAGHSYGISTCWFNPNGKPASNPSPTYEARTFDDVMACVRSG